MSLESWKAEFYQLDADNPAVQVDDETRVRHSLQKWRGLTKENLGRHGVKAMIDGDIKDKRNRRFVINADSCSLCLAYVDEESDPCFKCPLYQARNTRCDYETANETNSPFHEWDDNQNPAPMIAALEATLEMVMSKKGPQ